MFSLFQKKTGAYPPLSVFNTESRKSEIFEPLSSEQVTMYSCGPTVYDNAHIGNLRTYVFSDLLKRTLQYNGYTVNHTINFTDFGHLTSDADTGDDKMMKGLAREGMRPSLENMRTLSETYITAFKKDMDELSIIPPTQYARASDYVKEQIALIKTLEEKGYTYRTSDGIYFDISKFPTYGRLGNIDIEALRSGTRVTVNKEKKNPADFAVWKNGELGWESIWGKGFPGWHIECSAMAFATLGKQIDIHTGGVDNISTHHNGEIAQSEAITNKRFVHYWMHGEHLQIHDKKIAKSDGNSIYLKDLAESGIDGTTYRYWLLTAHYRSTVNFSYDALHGAKQALQRLQRLVHVEWAQEKGKLHQKYHEAFVAAINNDLDMPNAVARMWDLIKDDSVSMGDKRMTIIEFDTVFGLGLASHTQETPQTIKLSDLPEEVARLMQKREDARASKNWEEADTLRNNILEAGYTVEDTPDGAQIKRI